jgi:hypothetical protein
MTRAVGFALLLFGFIAPLVAPLCAARCQMMQSSFSAGAASFDAAPLPCCAGGQTAVVPPMQVKPQANYQTAVDLHAPVAAVLFHEPLFVPAPSRFEERSVFPSSVHTSAVLRI